MSDIYRNIVSPRSRGEDEEQTRRCMVPLSGPVRQVPLVAQVSEQFRRLVESGAWPIGARIPGENQLAEQLGVSRGTVREALRALSLVGLLEPRVGDGTYVRARNELSGLLARDEPSTALDHVLDTRAALEASAARLAALRGDTEGLAAVEAAARERDAAHELRDRAAYVVADARFHRAVVQASGNPLLLRLYDAVEEILVRSIDDIARLPEPLAVHAAHDQLLRALLARDEKEAGAAAYALIESVRALGLPALP